MSSQPPITPEELAALPPYVQAIIRSIIKSYDAQIAQLECRIAELETRLGKSPRNSSLPPSSQHPHAKGKEKRG